MASKDEVDRAIARAREIQKAAERQQREQQQRERDDG